MNDWLVYALESSSSQVLNFTQHIEDEFENKQITGDVDATAAYYTTDHKSLLLKTAGMI